MPLASRRLDPIQARAIRHGLWVFGLVTALLAVGDVRSGDLGFDAHAYWAAWSHHLYWAGPEQRDAYLYSPAFAEAIWPLTRLPWWAFSSVWLGAIAAAYLWLLAPLPLRWRLPALLACSLDVVSGNVWAFFAVVAVLGLRRPWLWAFPALTKVTPVLGPVWFAARREWRAATVAVCAPIVVGAISFGAAPDLWHQWTRLLLHPDSFANGLPGDMTPVLHLPTAVLLAVELPIAAGITVYAARTGRRALLPVAMLFANPVLTANAVVLLAAVPRLARDGGPATVAARASVSAGALASGG